ncbi:MAG TPA: S24 family peptidase [Bacillota bacterium]|nr:S24 family peptidase [Bacillota bacterium]
MQEQEENDRASSDGVSVHTGFPNPATDSRLSGLDLNTLLIRHGASTYMFRVQGNEWEGAGVFEGDVAIVDRALDPKKRDVVLGWDEDRGEFIITPYASLPAAARLWGVITATIHEFRKRLPS